jgi:heptosyltransferase-2
VVSASSLPPSIGLTKALVKRFALLVTTDSGPRHFAAAFDVPVVTLFGPTHIEWTETYFSKAVHLQEKLPCGPCQQRVCPLGHHQCMTQLSAQRVAMACFDLLRRQGGSEVRHAS